MTKHLYAIWLGDVLFCFSGETSEPKVDAWTRVVKRMELQGGVRPFATAALRLAEVKYPAPPVEGSQPGADCPDERSKGSPWFLAMHFNCFWHGMRRYAEIREWSQAANCVTGQQRHVLRWS